MAKETKDQGVAVPTARISRLGRLGGTVAGIAGRMAVQGAGDLARGRRPQLGDLLLTPANVTRITDQLSQMRGAAMKMGQLLSMETGDMLPPELATILGRLRSEAHFMPPAQLKKVLIAGWGADFMKRFARFDVRPIAAASIGQVHRAQTRDGRDLAIKVQYPGVRDSIDSDVRNLGMLLKTPGLLPKGLRLDALMADVATELHAEADYQREATFLKKFGKLLQGDQTLLVPDVHDDLSTPDILAMTYLEGAPVEGQAGAAQPTRDHIADALIRLLLREIFDLRVMQTDPNFANYQVQPETGKIVLLDFGAARDLAPESAGIYKRLLRAGLAQNRDDVAAALTEIGFLDATVSPENLTRVLDVFDLAMGPLRAGGVYDFGTDTLAQELRAAGLDFAEDRSFSVVPPIEALLIQRKIGGIYLLATRLRAKVNLTDVIAPYV